MNKFSLPKSVKHSVLFWDVLLRTCFQLIIRVWENERGSCMSQSVREERIGKRKVSIRIFFKLSHFCHQGVLNSSHKSRNSLSLPLSQTLTHTHTYTHTHTHTYTHTYTHIQSWWSYLYIFSLSHSSSLHV